MWSASSCSIFLASWAQSQDILQVAVCVGFDGWVCEFAFVDPAAFFLECQLCSCHWRLREKRLYAGPCSVYTPPSKNKKDLPLQTISSRPYPWVCGHAQTLHMSLRLLNEETGLIGELYNPAHSYPTLLPPPSASAFLWDEVCPISWRPWYPAIYTYVNSPMLPCTLNITNYICINYILL